VGVKGSDLKKKSQAEVVDELIEQVEKKLGGNDVKVTLADYIRLVQLRKELEEETPKEIKVTWIERDPESSSET
jgi:hypothetical protein